MNNLEPERNKLFESQQNVLEKIQRNNQLFWFHFAALVLFLISSVMLTILLVFSFYDTVQKAKNPVSPYMPLVPRLFPFLLVKTVLHIQP